MKLGSLFDGIGGFPLAASRCDIEPVWASEIEKFPIEVTKLHFPDMKHLGDITKLKGSEIEPVDIITGGSPCQDLSVAGKRAGLTGERSGLFIEMIRVIREMREATNGRYPRFVIWENVPGALSSNEGKDFQAVVQSFIEIGAVDISWRVLDARYFGVPQRRRRIFLVADFAGGCTEQILFEPEGVSGNFKSCRKAREEATTASGTSVEAKGFRMTAFGEYADDDTASTVKARDYKDATDLVLNDQGGSQMGISYGITGTLRAQEHGHQPIVIYDMHHACDVIREYKGYCPSLISRMGTGGNNVPLTMASKQISQNIGVDIAMPIMASDYKEPQVVCYGIDQQGGKGQANYAIDEVPTLCSDSHGTPHAVAFGPGGSHKVSHALRAGASRVDKPESSTYVCSKNYTVRRLTPLECERLQGYPDGWTEGGSDSARYKALGNSVAVPVVQWIMSRLVTSR